MSNSRLTNGVISNYAEMKKRRLVHKLGVVYETTYEQTKSIPMMIKNIVDKTENAIFDRCHFIEFANSSLDLNLSITFLQVIIFKQCQLNKKLI